MAVPKLDSFKEVLMPSGINEIVETFGPDALERRLSEHAVAAQNDAKALKASASHGLAMLRLRDETLLRAMHDELGRATNPQ